MGKIDYQFAMALDGILRHGSKINTRNSDTLRAKNILIEMNSTPLISARKTSWKSALREFEWFMSGSCDVNTLHESVRPWWKPWANASGKITNNYSEQLRGSSGKLSNNFDQIKYLEEGIKNHPYSRRNLITTWNTADMAHVSTAITNCHGTVIQCLVEPEDNSLHMTMIQRSSDMVVGLQHNLIQYWAFLQYLAHKGGRKVGGIVWHGIDCHIYESHTDIAREIVAQGYQIPRDPAPQLVYTPTSEEFLASDFSLDAEYKPKITSKVEMIV